MRVRTFLAILLLLLSSLLLVQCASTPQSGGGEGKTLKMAAIFPGVITDSDYNTLGYLGLEAVNKKLGIETAYSESVAVPDTERVIREYIDGGYNIIFTHGGQFLSKTAELAKQFPDVYFIGEGDAAVQDPPPNLWVIDRNFHVGFYAIGALAGLQSQTGKIGYLGGLTLPFSYAEVHAMQQAIDDLGLNVKLTPVWVGNFNDPAKARELADAMIADDNDVLVGSLNQGMLGVFEAVKATPKTVWVTAKYTDKSSFAPDNYLTSLLYDFAGPLTEIVSKIQAGESGGYYPLGFKTGVALQEPQHVSDDVKKQVDQIIQDLKSGKIKVEKNTEPIE
ncbi:MAG TPA: BMP family ABC transporter substrate-binding protein [Anaerolineae bacterium]|nr:BMP family ABC transporter substrate-binding protein [Anaerolineae bacterium]